MNIRRLAKQYENLDKQIQRGKCVGFYWQGSKLIQKYRPWLAHELAVREAKKSGIMSLIAQARVLYDSEGIREAAIATVNEEGVFRYVPLSKTGMKLYEIEQIRKS